MRFNLEFCRGVSCPKLVGESLAQGGGRLWESWVLTGCFVHVAALNNVIKEQKETKQNSL